MNRIPVVLVSCMVLSCGVAHGAYHHGGDTDLDIVLDAYPLLEGTQLEICALCHTGGKYERKQGVWVELSSCQWCHYSYGYAQDGYITETLNGYGCDYDNHGRNIGAFAAMELLDSDEDGFSSEEEIAAFRNPGNSKGDQC